VIQRLLAGGVHGRESIRPANNRRQQLALTPPLLISSGIRPSAV
jgi:hypothetical protein